jgi:hypothetical protein
VIPRLASRPGARTTTRSGNYLSPTGNGASASDRSEPFIGFLAMNHFPFTFSPPPGEL